MQEKCDHRSGTYSTLNHNNASKGLQPPVPPGRIFFVELDAQMDAIRDLHSVIANLYSRLDCFMEPVPGCPSEQVSTTPSRIVETIANHSGAIRYATRRLSEMLERLDV
jgi:hypothetical protein